MREYVVQRRKARSYIALAICTPIFLMFFFASAIGLLDADDWLTGAFAALVLLISCMALAYSFMLWDKTTSKNPELIITDTEIEVFDNLYVSKIPLADTEDCRLYTGPQCY